MECDEKKKSTNHDLTWLVDLSCHSWFLATCPWSHCKLCPYIRKGDEHKQLGEKEDYFVSRDMLWNNTIVCTKANRSIPTPCSAMLLHSAKIVTHKWVSNPIWPMPSGSEPENLLDLRRLEQEVKQSVRRINQEHALTNTCDGMFWTIMPNCTQNRSMMAVLTLTTLLWLSVWHGGMTNPKMPGHLCAGNNPLTSMSLTWGKTTMRRCLRKSCRPSP